MSDQLLGYYFGGTDGGYTNYLEGYASINKSVPSSLKSVKILGGTSINRYAFYNLSLDIIEIPNTLTSFNNEVYSVKTIKYAGDIEDWCSMSINVRGGSGIIDVYFNGTKVDNLVVPSTITEIPTSAFASFSIQSLTIPSTVKWIGDWAFSGCRSLTSVTILDGVTSIGERAFNGCRSLTSITIPNSVTSIGSSAFSGCSSLTSVTIPDSVTSIGRYAFSDCSSLTSVTIIACHNIFVCDSNNEDDKDKYRKNKLSHLIVGNGKFHKMPNMSILSRDDYGKLYYLLALTDTLEPTKRGLDVNNIDIEVEKLDMSCEIILSNINDERYLSGINSLPKWLDCVDVKDNGKKLVLHDL